MKALNKRHGGDDFREGDPREECNSHSAEKHEQRCRRDRRFRSAWRVDAFVSAGMRHPGYSYCIHPKKWARTTAGSEWRSSSVKKSMVPNWRSNAGGPQILAPRPRKARMSLGGRPADAPDPAAHLSSAWGLVRHSGRTKNLPRR